MHIYSVLNQKINELNSTPHTEGVTKRFRKWVLTLFPDAKGFVLAIFIYAGMFKGDERLSFLPIDLTLLAGIISFFFGLLYLIKYEYEVPKAMWLILGLYFFCALPMLYTDWTDYAIYKVFRIFMVTMPASVLPLILLRTWGDIRNFINAITVLAITVSIEGVMKILTSSYMFSLEVYSGDYLSLGRMSGIASIWLIILFAKSGGLEKIFYLSVVALPLYIMIASGSRGPVLSFLIAITVLSLLYFIPHRRSRISLLIVIGFLFIAINASLIYAPEGARDRLGDMFGQRMDVASTQRPELFQMSIEEISGSFLGTGWGGFERVMGKNSVIVGGGERTARFYPHNLLFEAFLEGGWLLGIFLVAIIILSLKSSYKFVVTSPNKEGAMIFASSIFFLSTAMSSGDWNDNRDLFTLLSLGLTVFSISISTNPNNS